MNVSILRKEKAARIKDLVSSYEFNDYRAYRMLNKEKLKECLFSQIITSLENKGNWIVVAEDKNEIVGLASLNFLTWDTEHFGIEMSKIDYLMARGDYAQTLAIKNKLLSYLFLLCKKEEIVHLACRIDVSDTSSIHALEANGFRLMDALVTYVFNRHKHSVPNIKDIYKIREFKEEDLSVLVDIAKNSFSRDRFHLDTHISKEKADDMFGEWIKNSCRGLYADKVFVAERRGEAIGFLTFRLDRELEKLMGYKICGHGLSAVSPKVKGAYPGLAKSAVQEIALHFDCLEFDTQLNNYEVVKIWQRFGFDFIRAKYTFHNWLRQ